MTNFVLTRTPSAILNAKNISTHGALLAVNWFGITGAQVQAIVKALGAGATLDASLHASDGFVYVVHPDITLTLYDDGGEMVAHAMPQDASWNAWLRCIQEVSRAVGSTAHLTMFDGSYLLGVCLPHLDAWLVRESFHSTLDTESDSDGFGRHS